MPAAFVGDHANDRILLWALAPTPTYGEAAGQSEAVPGMTSPAQALLADVAATPSRPPLTVKDRAEPPRAVPPITAAADPAETAQATIPASTGTATILVAHGASFTVRIQIRPGADLRAEAHITVRPLPSALARA